MPTPYSRPENATVCYEAILSLRQDQSWEGMIPARKEQIIGWLKSSPYRKRQRETMSEEDFNRLIEEKAQHILNEVTWGSFHEGKDSLLPADVRFKRTKNGSLFFGAGGILGMIEEAALLFNPRTKIVQRLRNRLWITPGKVVIYRLNANMRRVPITKADGRHERTIPPIYPSISNFFKGKPATIVFPEQVRYPAYLHFFLWMPPEQDPREVGTWLIAGQEIGIGGGRQLQNGQFDLVRFQLAHPNAVVRLLAREKEKVEEENRGTDDEDIITLLNWA